MNIGEAPVALVTGANSGIEGAIAVDCRWTAR